MNTAIFLRPEEPLSIEHQTLVPPIQKHLEPVEKLEAVFIPTVGSEEELAQAAYLASLADPTPNGKLIAELALRKVGTIRVPENSKLVYASQNYPICGINLYDHMIRKGSISSIEEWVRNVGGYFHCRIRSVVSQILKKGGFAIVIANESVDLGVIYLRRAT
jgi:K+-transporting ATPase ATPase B chain